ncbi:von Willebrand factor type A domain-containing protein [Trichoderma sp. SZMC 28014]
MQQYFLPNEPGYGYSHAWRQALPPGPTCGLYIDFYGHRRFISLVSLEAHTTIVSSTSRTVLTQTFQSPNIVSAPCLENVTYIFPLYDGVSVVAFTCTVGSRVIKGVVKERSEAKTAFDAAVAQGKTAGLLEQSLEASDVFTTSLGNIPTGEPITVEVTYLGELKHDAQVDGLRFTIPTSLAPRYGHHALQGFHTALGKKHISITVDVDVSGSSTIKSVQSPSHPISVNIGTLSTATAEPPSLQRAYATLSQRSTELDKDFVIQVVANGLGDPIAVLEEHPTIPNQRALMATLVPRFSLPPSMSEVVFMCDRSGSMGSGGKIPNVIAALKVFLKSLPIGVKFNICSFGSHHSFLWERSQTYDENSLRTAISHVGAFDANLGGTEMYNPMADIFKRRYSDMNLEVFLLTDGETWDQQALFQLINSNVSQSQGAIRIFTLGVGAMASHALIQGVARAGNGFAQAVADGERVDKMLVRMLKGALTPHVTDYTLEIKYGNDEMSEEESGDDFEVIEKIMDAMTLELPLTELSDISASGSYNIEISLFDESVEDEDLEMSGTSDVQINPPAVAVPRYLQAPFQIPPLFPFNRTTVYVLLSDSTPDRQPKSVILRGTSPQGPLSLEIPITILANKGTTIHQLAARKAMRELEDGRGWIFHAKDEQEQLLQNRYEGQFSDMVKREAVRLGTQYQVSGKWCSFVAIEDDEIKGVESEEIGIIDDDDSSVTRIGTDTGSSDTRSVDTRFSDTRSADTRSADTRSADTRSGGEDVRRRNTAASARFRRQRAQKTQNEIQDEMRRKILESAPKVLPAEAAQPPVAQPQMMAPPYMMNMMDHSDEAAEEAASESASGLEDTPMSTLFFEQTFIGYWDWSSRLETIVGMTRSAALADIQLPGQYDQLEVVLATLCAVVYLKKKQAREKDVWELIVQKAEDWLRGQTQQDIMELEKIVEGALFADDAA